MGREEPLETPKTQDERMALMKEIAHGWCEPFRSFVLDVPEETCVKVVRLEDWVPGTEGRVWDNRDGRVTLVGDAAHAMTMCMFLSLNLSSCGLCNVLIMEIVRGEAANHGIKDVAHLYREVFASPSPLSNTKVAILSTSPPPPNKAGVDVYEHEMITRTKQAVMNSRRACLDSSDHKSITENSPLVSRRAVVLEYC